MLLKLHFVMSCMIYVNRLMWIGMRYENYGYQTQDYIECILQYLRTIEDLVENVYLKM